MEQKLSLFPTPIILLVFSAVVLADNENGFPYHECTWLECTGIKGDNGGCVNDKICDVLLIRSGDYTQQPPLVAHRLYWIPKSTAEEFPYAAVGYSKDTDMGDDAVTACSHSTSYDFMTGLTREEQFAPTPKEVVQELYAKQFTGFHVCAWTTQLKFTKTKRNTGNNIEFDLSTGEYILLGRGSTKIETRIESLTLRPVSKNPFKFDRVACDPQAYILENFYCWSNEGSQNEWSLYVTIHVKEQSTRFQLSFTNKQSNQAEGSISVGLSLHPLSKSTSLVKCSWNGRTVSIQEAFESTEGIKDSTPDQLITNMQGHIGNAYVECIWSRSLSSWTKNPLYLSIQADKLNNNVPKFTDWPLVFPDFTDEELGDLCGNCVGMRDGNETNNECVDKKKCLITLVVEQNEGKYKFSVRSALTFGVWTSVSLSAVASSKEKLGFDCNIKGEVDAKPSGEVTTTTNKDEKGSKAVKILDAKLTEKPRRMTCEFEVEKPITLPSGEKGTTLDLEKNGAFITIAFGRFSGQKEEARQSVSLTTPFKVNDDDGQAESTFLVYLSLTFVALFVVSTLTMIGLGLYLYHPKKRKGVKVKKGAKRKSLKIKSRKSSPVGSKIDKGSPTSNI